MSTNRLTISDSVQEWIDKINALMDLQNVDGAFTNQDTVWENTEFSLSGGTVRFGNELFQVVSTTLNLPTRKTLIVGVESLTKIITYYEQGNTPSDSFIPMYIVTTNNSRIISAQDTRSWAYASSYSKEVEDTVSLIQDHIAAEDPHSQYALKADVESGRFLEWSSSIDYEDGAIVKSDGNLYSLLKGKDYSVDPSQDDGTNWALLLDEITQLSITTGKNVILKAVPNSQVFVYKAGTNEVATGVEDKEGNPLAVPFNADADGFIQYAAPNGEYDLRVISGQRQFELRVQCFDGGDLGAAAVKASGSETERTLGDWVEGQVYNYKTLQNVLDDANLLVGSIVETAGYYVEGDGGGNRYISSSDTSTYSYGASIQHPSGFRLKGLFPDGIRLEQFGVQDSQDSSLRVVEALEYADGKRITSYWGRVDLDSPVYVSGIDVNMAEVELHTSVQGNRVIDISGTLVGATSLSESLTIGSRYWVVDDASLFSEGMLVELKSSKSWYYDPRPEATDARKSELNKVASVVGNTVYLYSPTNDGYDLSEETVEVLAYQPIKVSLHNVTASSVLPEPGESTPAGAGVKVSYSDGPVLSYVNSVKNAAAGIVLAGCYAPVVLGGVSEDSNYYFTGYGLQTQGCRNGIIRGRITRGSRRAVDISGAQIISIGCRIESCVAEGGGVNSRGEVYSWMADGSVGAYQGGFGSHGAADGTRYINNTTYQLHNPINIRGGRESIEGHLHVGRTRGGVVTWSYGDELSISALRAEDGIGPSKETGIFDNSANINSRRPDLLLSISSQVSDQMSLSLSGTFAEVQEDAIVFENPNAETYNKLVIDGLDVEYRTTTSATTCNLIRGNGAVIRDAYLANIRTEHGFSSSGGRIYSTNGVTFRDRVVSSRPLTYNLLISDNDVGYINNIPLPKDGQKGLRVSYLVTSGRAYADFVVFEASSTTVNLQNGDSTGVVSTVPTGTTGTDGNATFALVDGVLYVENRLGSGRRFSITILGTVEAD